MQDKFFRVEEVNNWRTTNHDFVFAANHSEAVSKLCSCTVRILNAEYRAIETTGHYFRITEEKAGGKTFIFKVLANQ